MRIQPFKRFNRDDYRDAQEWFYTLLDALNPLIDTLNIVLQGNIDIDNNLMAERHTISVVHGVSINVRMISLKAAPKLVRVGYANGYVGVGAVNQYNADGTVQVTVYFQGTPPTKAIPTVLVFEP